MALKLITAAVSPPVTLNEAKLHLRVDVSDDDDLINAFIDAATEMAEQATGRAIMTQTWDLTLDAFPDAFELTRTPVQSIVSIKYSDTSGVQQTLSSSLYSLDNLDDYGCAYVVPSYGANWPLTRGQINAVTLRFITGWPDAASVPDGIKSWIKLMVGNLYENRESERIERGSALSLGFADRLLDRYRIWKL